MAYKWFETREFMIYTTMGGIVTLVDWFLFALTNSGLHWHYQIALIIGSMGGALSHYTLNKWMTFKFKTSDTAFHIPMYLIVMALSLSCSLVLMALLVNYIPANKILLRMLTTLIMLVPNYLFHKHLSFNHRIFTRKV